MNNPIKAPITAKQRLQLLNDAKDICGTALRKGLSQNDGWLNHCEAMTARFHFELGCWLFYYQHLRAQSPAQDLRNRVDCLRRLYLSEFFSPGYRFHTVFDFGGRQYDDILEMGDSAAVIDGLRKYLRNDTTGKLADAFRYNAWPLTNDSTADLFAQVA